MRHQNLPNKYQQDEGIKLGLSREQVLAPNFGQHTVAAIRNIQKRTEGLSSSEAFEMVKGKSYVDTEAHVKAYLEATKKAQKPIGEMALIRVVVNTGRGFGHQRAAITLMQKLREMGFQGIFDIQCDDRLHAFLVSTKTGKFYINQRPLVSAPLISMIPDFSSVESNSDGVKVVNGLGAVKISSLPNDYKSNDPRLPEADLAVCAAEDSAILNEDKKAKIFNATSYIGLEPTDWGMGSCFVTDMDGVVIKLPKASVMRLSSEAAYKLPDISSVPLSATEQRIIDITGHTEINSQLVYGLYPEMVYDIESKRMKVSGNLDEATEMQRIVAANLSLSQKIRRSSILLLPQTIALDEDFIRKIKGSNENIHVVDLTKGDLALGTYAAGDVIVAHTGRLQQPVFDYLMLQGTTLPPVIEGCNAREVCESAGRAFIHGSAKHAGLKQYEVMLVDKQELHRQACLCLERGDPTYLPQLVQYMEESLTSNPELIAYHEQRREAYFRRPDACEVALNALGVKYEKSSQKASTGLGYMRKLFSYNELPKEDDPQRKKPRAGPCIIS